jgi:hypothetical protein
MPSPTAWKYEVWKRKSLVEWKPDGRRGLGVGICGRVEEVRVVVGGEGAMVGFVWDYGEKSHCEGLGDVDWYQIMELGINCEGGNSE